MTRHEAIAKLNNLILDCQTERSRLICSSASFKKLFKRIADDKCGQYRCPSDKHCSCRVWAEERVS